MGQERFTFGRAIGGAYRRFIEWVSAHPTGGAVLLLLAVLPAIVLTAQFFANVHAGLEELLPRDAPSVRALSRIHERLGGKANLTIIVQSPDPESNRRFMDELSDAIEARHLPVVRSVQGGCKTERAWVRDHAALLLPADKIEPWLDEIEDAVKSAKARANPLFLDLEEDSEPSLPDWSKLERQIDEEAGKNDRFPNGYFETQDGNMVVGLVWLEGTETELGPSEQLFHAVTDEVGQLRSRYRADLKVAYSGEVVNLLEEHSAILADLSLSSAVVFVLVGGLIAAYFRSTRSIFAVLFALIPGLAFTLAIGKLTIGYLNSNTAFLGSIIAGNGINYPLLFLAYYRRRSPLEPRGTALFAAASQALPGTLAAAATASAAYGGLAASTFKGFSQFGWLGGVGMLTTWLFTYISMPVAVSLFDPPRLGERPTRMQLWLMDFFSKRRAPQLVAGLFVAGTIALGSVGARFAVNHGMYETDLRGLRNRDSLRTGGASWDAKIGKLFGVWLNPIVALLDDPLHREVAAAELRRVLTEKQATGEEPVVQRVETISQYVPAATAQQTRLVRLRQLAHDVARMPRENISERGQQLIDTWLSPKNLQPITDRDVPAKLRQAFVEVTGQADRVVLVYPSLTIDYNDSRNIIRLSDEMSKAHLPTDAVFGGGFLFMGEIIRLVHDEAPRVVLVVYSLVALVLWPIFRRRPKRILLVLATVGVVAVSAQAVMFAVGVQLNMLNFAAVPITIGVGADYVVNLLGAMESLKVDARRACAQMGGAILLCSLTTIVGYLSLVIAQSGALRTFGWAAVTGELMAVAGVLLALPVLLPEREMPPPLQTGAVV